MQIFWLLTLAVFMGAALLSLRWGVILYLIGALIFPSLWLGETTAVRFELIYCLWLLFVFFLRIAVLNLAFRWHPVLSKYGLFLLVIVLSTMFALVGRSSEGSLIEEAVSLYGILRPLLVMWLVLNISVDERFASRVLQALLWLTVPIALLSIEQTLGANIAQQVTLQGYTSPSRTPVFNLLEELGVITRSTGVFESPVYNAVYFVLILTTVGFALVIGSPAFGSKRFLYLLFGLAAVAGTTTLTSTFLMGATLAVAVLVFMLGYRYPKRLLQFAVAIAGVASMFVIVGLPYFTQQGAFAGTLNYQVNKILSGTLLYTRYSSEDGQLRGTYEAIQERPVIGWGLTEREGAFVGDSLYISVFYWGGIIGLGSFLWLVCSILKHAWRNRGEESLRGQISWMVLLWTLLLLATGVGSPSFFILRLQEWYWALVGVSLNLCSQANGNKTRHEHAG